MASRYDIRKTVIQTLFECDFRGSFDLENIQSVLRRNFKEIENENGDNSEIETDAYAKIPEFAETLALGVLSKKDILDDVIRKSAPEWPLEKIDCTDRNVLRLGLFELLYPIESGTPSKVAINEAIEMGRAFGGETSAKFINGVLGNVFKDLQNQNG